MRPAECDRIEELLPLYLDGELSLSESAEVDAHVESCAECAAALETYRSLESSLASMPGFMPDPGGVSGAVTRRLGIAKRRRLAPVFTRMSLVWSIAVATASLILLVSRFDFVSAILAGQEGFIEASGRAMERWIGSSSAVIADFFAQVEASLASDPWLLTAGLVGFGMVIFAAGTMAAIRSLR